MTKIKAFTDLYQSKKLVEFLPINSADMFYNLGESKIPNFIYGSHSDFECYTMCWSLAALIDIVKTYSRRLNIALRADKNYNIFAVYRDFTFYSFDDFPDGFDNPVDGCVEMIKRLHELNLL